MQKRLHTIWLVVLLLSNWIVSIAHTADITEGLVVYFTFDNVKGKHIRDESGNGLDAEVIGNTQFVEGKYGKAIRITRETEDCVNIPNSHKLEIDDEITMMAWVYHENWKGHSSQWFDKGVRTQDLHTAYGMAVYDEKDLGGAVRLEDDSGIGMVLGAGIPQSQQIILVNNTMEDKKWHHIVGTVGDNGAKIYLDGEPITHVNENVNFKGTNKEDFRIGCVKNNPQYSFKDGSIDEVAIWSRGLSEDEIRRAMRGPLLSIFPKDKVTTTWGDIKRKAF